MLYPIGINSSYAQTDPARAIGDTLDLTGIANYNPECTLNVFDDLFAIDEPTDYSLGSFPRVTIPPPCFMDNTRTWQAFVLNADDDTIVYSTEPVTTSALDDLHNISSGFTGIDPNTDYRFVLLLTGSYSANSADLANYPYVDDTTVFDIWTVTTDDLGYAPDITLQALTGSAGTLDISFKQLFDNGLDVHRISNYPPFGKAPTVPDYADSDITLRLQTADTSIYNSITGVTGVTVNPGDTDSTDTFIVNGDVVTISTTLGNTYNSDIHFDYTVTGTDGVYAGHTDTGVLTITFVDTIQNIIAIPYTSNEGEITIRPYSVFTALYISGENLDTFQLTNQRLRNMAITTTGTGDQSGTLTLNNVGPRVDFTYTPATSFAGGTETFPYTATFEGVSSSSTISFVSPTVCAASVLSGINFGTLDNGETSDVQFFSVNNDGTTNAQVSIRGDNWKSVTDSSVTTMDVGVTKYSVQDHFTTSYDDRTELTSAPTEIGTQLRADESINFTMQLLLNLIDPTFRGVTTQELTISAVC